MTKYIRYGKEYERKDKKINYNTTLNIRISEYLMEKINEVAKRLNETSSKFIRETLEERIEKEKNNENN